QNIYSCLHMCRSGIVLNRFLDRPREQEDVFLDQESDVRPKLFHHQFLSCSEFDRFRIIGKENAGCLSEQSYLGVSSVEKFVQKRKGLFGIRIAHH
ncbi:hypothetical protein PFISCL1PPCAC_14020, partial [Pristionchus fissidentatus]